MSSIKDLFGNKNNKVLPGKSLGDLVTGSGVESAGYIEKDDDNKRRFEPRVDFSQISNFARYGSAEKYYEDAIDHISHHFPYDGSGKEKITWHLSSSYFDNYIFENEYPRTNGYITLGLNYDFDGPDVCDYGYDTSTRDEWISFRGGPHTASGGMTEKPLSTTFTGSNYYNDTSRESNLELDGANGITLEFWINKQTFSAGNESRRQVIFDAWNNRPHSGPPTPSDYGRFRVEISGSGVTGEMPPIFHVELLSGSDGLCNGILSPPPMMEMTATTLTGSWNHFALSFINTDTQMLGKLYQNGSEVDSVLAGTPMGKVTGSMFGRIGALETSVMDLAGGTCGSPGDAKLSASLDEVRFWKTKRTETEIGRYWFTQVNAGTNTDIANVDLGIYYKFNEGIVDTTSVAPLDTRVLDYSGRISNGSWTGYQVGSRFTGSAMVEASASLAEFKDPIIYQSNPLVAVYKSTQKNVGYDYDVRNNAGIYTSIPEYITGDPVEVEGETLKKLTQIMGSYFDSLQLQIESMPRIKDVEYTSGSQKVAPFVNRFLEGVGLYAPEIFADAGALEYYASRDDFIEFSKKLSDTKNRLYENIYNNVVNIFKTKGTEESFRNLMRCYGVDEPLMKISLYGDEVTQELRTNTRNTAARKVFVDFNNVDRFDSTVYQQTASADTDTRNFITASSDMEFIPKTMQAEAIFPKKFKRDSELYFRTPFLSCSLFGAHTPITTDQTDLTWQTPDISNFQVYAVRTEVEGDDAYFQLTSSTGGVIPNITSSVFTNVYDNNKWNLAVRVRPETNYAPGLSGSQWGSASVEFIGYNSLGDNVENDFYLTASIPMASGSAFLSSSTRIYVGAHRTNFTGSQLEWSDAKISSTRYWIDNLPNEAIEAHSKDASSFGPLEPHKSAYLVKNSADFFQQIQAPQSKTLAVSWTFDTVTGSGDSSTGSPTLSDATFFVPDMTSGSVATTSRYGWLGPVVNMRHPGKGDFFLPFDANAVNREYVYSAKQLAPEILNSSNMIEVRTQDDNLFTRETRPQNYFYAIEKSQAAIISEEMMKWFATIKDFNFLIGDPVNRYRQEYKTLAQMRELYFRTVGNTMSFERFVEFFKWVDSALSEMLLQLVPASANFAEKVRTMIESHVLERSKYWSKFPTLEMKLDDPEAGLRGIVEGVYPWKRGHAPIPLAQDEDCFWWQHRATASLSSSGDIDIDAARDIYRLANDFRPNAKTPTLTDIATTPHTQYQGSAYALRNLTQPYLFRAKEMHELKGGSNVARIKNIQYAHTELPFGATTQLKVMSSEVESDIDCNDVVDPNDKVKLRYKLTNNPISYLSGKGNLFAPFDLFSSSVSSGYQASLAEMGTPAQKIALNNYHDDFYGNDKEIPMQGPFTEKYVGGWVHRHVPFPNTDCPSTGSLATGSLATGSLAEECRPEAWNLDIAFDSGKSVLFDNGAPPFAGESLDITSDDGTVANFPFGGADFPFTITAWFKTGTDGDYSVIIGRCGWPTGFALNGDFRLIEMFGQLRFDVWDAGGNLRTGTWTTNTYDDGNWHFACFGWESDQAFLFVDGGAEVLTHFCSGRQGGYTATPPQPEDFRLRFGELQPTPHIFGTAGWNGSLSSVAFWPSGLDATQAIEFYNNGCPLDLTPYTGPPGNLQAWWRMGDAPGDSTDSADPSARIYDVIGGYDATPTVMVAGNIKEDSPPCATGIGNLTLTSRTAHQARSTILREPLAKRPVNIRNIKQTTGSTVIGNYSHEYEVLQTSDRKINNRFFVKNEGFVPEYKESPWIVGLVDYVLPDFSKYGATKNIFVERFNAPGGPDVSSRGVLDLYSEQFAIGNDLNYRNMAVRGPLNEWSTEHCGQFGIKSGSTVNELNYDTSASYFKVNRNPLTIPSSYTTTTCTDPFTNSKSMTFFGDPFIGSSPDQRFAWIAPSVVPGPFSSGDGPTEGFSISMWMQTTSSYVRDRILMSRWESNTLARVPGECDWRIYIPAGLSDEILFEVVDDGTNTVMVADHTSAVVVGNGWHHILATFAKSGLGPTYTWDMAVMVDGNLDGPYTYPGVSQFGQTTCRTYIGAQYDSDAFAFPGEGANAFGSGSIDEVAHFGATLDPADAIALYNLGCPTDLTGMPNLSSWWRMGDAPGDLWDGGTSTASLEDVAGPYDGEVYEPKFGVFADDAPSPCEYEPSVCTTTTTYTCKQQYDNWWVQHPIPRSDYQYAWITASAITSSGCDFIGHAGSPDCGRNNFSVPSGSSESMAAPEIQFVSASTWDFPGITDGEDYEINFVGMLSEQKPLPTPYGATKYQFGESAIQWRDVPSNWAILDEGRTMAKILKGTSTLVSRDQLLGDGYLQFRIPEAITPMSVGFVDDPDAGGASFTFSYKTLSDGTLYIQVAPAGSPLTAWTGNYKAGELYRIRRNIEQNKVFFERSRNDGASWEFLYSHSDNVFQLPPPYNITWHLNWYMKFNDSVGTDAFITDVIVNRTTLSNTLYPGYGYVSRSYGFHNVPAYVNAYFNNINGPYGYPSWKEIRTGETPIARNQKNNNIISFKKEVDIYGSNEVTPSNAGLTRDTLIHFVEPPVTFRYKPLRTTLMLTSSTDPLTLDNVYGNNVGGFPNPDINNFLGTSIKCEEQMFDRLKDLYHNAPSDSPVSEMVTLNYNEVVYPREIHAGLKKYRQRTEYAEEDTWRYLTLSVGPHPPVAAFGTGPTSVQIRSSFGNQSHDSMNRPPLTRRTFWKDDVEERNRRVGWNTSSVGVLDWGFPAQRVEFVENYYITGALYNSQGHKDGYATSIYGLGENPIVWDFDVYAYGVDSDVGIGLMFSGSTMRLWSGFAGIWEAPRAVNPASTQTYTFPAAGYEDAAGGSNNPWTWVPNDAGELNSMNYQTIAGYAGSAVSSSNPGMPVPYTCTYYPTASAYFTHFPFLTQRVYELGDEGTYLGQDKSTKAFRWRVSELSGKKPWFNTYEDYVQDIRGIGKSFTIVPEFRISQHMKYYTDGMFRKQNDQILSLVGASITSSAQQITQSDLSRGFDEIFFNEYSNSDFQKYFGKISSDNTVSQITLKCNGIKKLLPYHGFYPAHRTLQCASLFSQSIAPYIGGISWSAGATTDDPTFPASGALAVQSLLQPYYAPGIMYNTIKSSVAVSWAAYTGSAATSFGTSLWNSGYIGSASNYVIPFESILDPLSQIGLPYSNSAGTGKLNLLYPTYQTGSFSGMHSGLSEAVFPADSPSGGRRPYVDIDNDSRASAIANGKYSLYKLAINNFLAEIPNFFLQDNTMKTIVSKPATEILLESGKDYYMDVVLEQSPDTFIWTDKTDSLTETVIDLNSYDGKSFGPPVQAGCWAALPSDKAWGNQTLGPVAPSFAPYTPPYYYGPSRVTLKYTADETDETNFSYTRMLSRLTASFSNPELDNIFNAITGTSGPCGISSDAPARASAQTITSSINIYGVFNPKQSVLDGNSGQLEQVIDDPNSKTQKWVISPRMETPYLDFSNQPYEAGYSRGIWSGYGNIIEGDHGITLGIENTFPANSISGSLADICFERPEQLQLGEIATQKEISEAIVAIPFAVRGYAKESRYPETTIAMDKNFFKIDSDKFDYYRDWFMQNKNAEAKTSPAKPSQSIQKMLTLMDKYIIPPELDFLTFNQGSLKVDPFVMYLFEFNHTLSQQDLADIWQGVMPDISRIAQLSDTTVDDNVFTHATGPDEFYGGKMLPDDIRWMVFKVKKRANFDYFKMTADTSDDAKFDFKFNVGGVELPYSYNWPYDYCSLVELAELEVQEQFVPYKPVAQVAGEDSENPAITRFVDHFKAIATGEEEE